MGNGAVEDRAADVDDDDGDEDDDDDIVAVCGCALAKCVAMKAFKSEGCEYTAALTASLRSASSSSWCFSNHS